MSLLPTKKSTPVENLKEYLIMLYGKPGIGKTTLASQFEEPLFLMFEPGAKSLSIYKKEISKWSTFVKIIDELVEKPDQFKTIVFDTLAIAYDLCLHHVSAKNGVEHPSELGYGKGWNAVETEFNLQLNRIVGTGRGIVLISHADDKEIEQWDGTTQTMTAPDLSTQAMRFIDRSVDLLAYYYYGKNNTRWIRIKATDKITAKNRIKGHFEGISRFEAGKNEEETYAKFVRAFENKLENK